MSGAIAVAGMLAGSPALEEARSTFATIVGNLIAIIRTIIAYAMEIIRRIMQWAGEHPLAFTLIMVNAIILFS